MRKVTNKPFYIKKNDYKAKRLNLSKSSRGKSQPRQNILRSKTNVYIVEEKQRKISETVRSNNPNTLYGQFERLEYKALKGKSQLEKQEFLKANFQNKALRQPSKSSYHIEFIDKNKHFVDEFSFKIKKKQLSKNLMEKAKRLKKNDYKEAKTTQRSFIKLKNNNKLGVNDSVERAYSTYLRTNSCKNNEDLECVLESRDKSKEKILERVQSSKQLKIENVNEQFNIKLN